MHTTASMGLKVLSDYFLYHKTGIRAGKLMFKLMKR